MPTQKHPRALGNAQRKGRGTPLFGPAWVSILTPESTDCANVCHQLPWPGPSIKWGAGPASSNSPAQPRAPQRSVKREGELRQGFVVGSQHLSVSSHLVQGTPPFAFVAHMHSKA